MPTPNFTMTNEASVHFLTDSLGTTFGGCYRVQWSLMRKFRTHFAPTGPQVPSKRHAFTPPSRQKWPRMVINGQAGRSTFDLITSTMAVELAKCYRCTKAVIVHGINDDVLVLNNTPPGTYTMAGIQANFTSIIASYASIWGLTASTDILVYGPYNYGTGGSAATQIAAHNAMMTTLSASLGFTYVAMSGIPNTVGTYSVEGTHPLKPASDAMATLVDAVTTYTVL